MTRSADRVAETVRPRTGAPGALRLLTLTTLFPNAAQPRHGIFVAQRLKRLCATGRVTSTVVAAIPRFPGAYRVAAAAPLLEQAFGVSVHHPRYLNVPGIGMRRQPDALARAILGELRRAGIGPSDVDVVDAHYFYPDGVAAARVADVLERPLVISARGSDINLIGTIPSARRRMIEASRRTTAMIAVSGALARAMAEMGMPADRTTVLRNGVDMAVFSPVPRAEARRRLGIGLDGTLVVAVANIVEEKGLDVLIDAVAAMPSTRALIVGRGPLRGALQGRADLSAPGRVTWREEMPQADLRDVYSAGNVLALPSLREGWPNVVLEAIACGTPVVAADVGGVAEILGCAGAPGCRIASRSASDWSRALADVVAAAWDPQRVRAYAASFGWDDIVERQCALYDAAASRMARPGAAAAHEVVAHA